MLCPERIAVAAKLLASDFLEKGGLGHEVQQAGRILERVAHLPELLAELRGSGCKAIPLASIFVSELRMLD